MSAWIDRILNEFTADLARLWIAADPDDVLLDERVLSGLRERGFELLRFDDSVAFRAEFEQRYRAAWDLGQEGPARALILHLRNANVGDLPWDYLRRGRQVSLSLADLFPRLSYAVVRQIGPEHRDALYAAQIRHATQSLGKSATKDFILTHIYRISPHLISGPVDLWRELLRLHYRDAALPQLLADHVVRVLRDIPAFNVLPLSDLFSSKATLLRIVQDAWFRYMATLNVHSTRVAEPPAVYSVGKIDPQFEHIDLPFEHPDVHGIVGSMFLDGLLHPLAIQTIPPASLGWASVGIIQDPLALRKLVKAGIDALHQNLPTVESSFRDWISSAKKFGEVLARFHTLDSARAEGLRDAIENLQAAADEQLRQWTIKHYADLPSLPVAKGPIMVHHIPRFLSLRRADGEDKIALLVFDGLAIDQWVQIREILKKRAPKLAFDEAACFAWLPTLTSVSRQAIFSGLKPREFTETIESTSSEPNQWSRFWQDHGLRGNEVMYRKSITRIEQLDELDDALSTTTLKVAGIVVDTVDQMVHGTVLGKRAIAAQIESWCETGFVERLLNELTRKGFSVYLTSDHGNVEAVGQGRPNQGVIAEMRGERVRMYRSETLAADSAVANPNCYRLEVAGLPANYFPLFAAGRTAFIPQGDQAVMHGGISVEELLVPFIKVGTVN